MKKTLLSFTLICLLIGLTACSSATSKNAASTNPSLSDEAQLLVGTLRLESTDLALTSDQAASLLPLWQTLLAMAESGTGADAEIQAIVSQVRGILTTAQLEDIDSMDLTSADLEAASSQNNTSSNNSGNAQVAAPDLQQGGSMGAPAGGNPPTDMGSAPADMGGTLSTSGDNGVITAPAASSTASNVASNQVPASLIAALVDLLKTRAG